MRYDLAERTKSFSLDIIQSLKKVKITFYNKNIVEQLLRSSTSIGANYQEANGAVSRSDFRNKVGVCKKEAMETTYWIDLLMKIDNNPSLTRHRQEAHELSLIFTKICQSSKPRTPEN